MQMSMFYLYFFHIGLPKKKKNNNKMKINKKKDRKTIKIFDNIKMSDC